MQPSGHGLDFALQLSRQAASRGDGTVNTKASTAHLQNREEPGCGTIEVWGYRETYQTAI